MGTHAVLDVFSLAPLVVEFFQLQGTGNNLIELLGTGAIELGGERGAAIDLQSADRERHAVQQGFEELDGGLGGGAGVSLNHIQREIRSRGTLPELWATS